MIGLEITRHAEHALVRASGRLVGAQAADALAASIDFVPEDDDLILDLLALIELDRPCARRLRVQLLRRASSGAVVVAVDDPAVATELLLCEIDRIGPIVRSLDDAVRAMRSRPLAAEPSRS